MYIQDDENEALKADRKEREYKPKYIKICVDMIGAIEMGMVVLSDGEYLIQDTEIAYCPFCGKKLLNSDKVAMGEIEGD